jgi:subtilisin family serine protease
MRSTRLLFLIQISLLMISSTIWISGPLISSHVYSTTNYLDEIPYGISLIGADKVWSVTQGSSDIIVAVLDSGINTSHFDLETILWNNSDEVPNNGVDDDLNGYIDDATGWNFVHQNNDPLSLLNTSWEALKFHGTHVAGTIVAQLNDLGIVGVAPNVTIMPLRVISEDNLNPDIVVEEAIRYATNNGANIISMSLGIYEEEITSPTSYQLVEEALSEAYSQGVIIVASAGNEAESNPIRPANNENVIAVGAINSNKEIASFSNRGSEVVAPGVSINSTIPYNDFGTSSGTSMAAPHVAGALALILSYNSSLSNIEVRTLLQQTATDLGITGWDSTFGYGLINVTKAFQSLSAFSPTTSTTSTDTSSTDLSSSSYSSSSTTSTTNLPLNIILLGFILIVIVRKRK